MPDAHGREPRQSDDGAAPPAPLTADELATIRARHTPWRDHRGRMRCAECAHTWPCDAARLLEACDDAEARLPTQGGGTLVLTAAELHAAHAEARGRYDRARFWAAGWRRAAYDFRDRGDVALDALERLDRRQARLGDRLDSAAAVIEAAGRLAALVPRTRRNDVDAAWRALDAALAAHDAAVRGH